jgi:hypothetical protein
MEAAKAKNWAVEPQEKKKSFKRPPLWSSSQSSWLHIQRSRVRFPALPDLLEIVGLERGTLSLVRITEVLLEWKSSGSESTTSRLTAVGIRCADSAKPSRLSALVNCKVCK